MNAYRAVVLASSILLLGASMGFAQGHTMSFFVTSVGGGDGANLGGLAGADAHCQTLADTAGVGHRTWRAYLSTEAPGARGGGRVLDSVLQDAARGKYTPMFHVLTSTQSLRAHSGCQGLT